jgi:hypothetical protein
MGRKSGDECGEECVVNGRFPGIVNIGFTAEQYKDGNIAGALR